MPNHVTTICAISGPQEDIEDFGEKFFTPIADTDSDERLFDFAKVIPPPDIICKTEASTVAEYGSLLLVMANANQFSTNNPIPSNWWDSMVAEVPEATPNLPAQAKAYLDKYPEYREKGSIRLQAIAETGYSDWYQWNIDNWGTKWGSYSVGKLDMETGQFKFDTAWSFPTPIFEKLAEMFPSITFDCKCFDEGWNFAGQGQFGNSVSEPFGTCEATDDLYEAVYGELPEID